MAFIDYLCDKLGPLNEDGHWEVYKGQRISFIVDPKSYGHCTKMNKAGLPQKRKKHKRWITGG